MFMCVSSVVLRAVSSGSAVMAALRLAAFDVRSLRAGEQAGSARG